MSEEPSTPPTDEFQQRVEELGLTEGHWHDVGERFNEYREKGMNPKDAILTAVDDFSHEDADLKALRRAWLREQHKFNDVEHTVEVEVPADVRDAIRKRMALFGKTPEENPDEWTDLAMDSTNVVFSSESRGNNE